LRPGCAGLLAHVAADKSPPLRRIGAVFRVVSAGKAAHRQAQLGIPKEIAAPCQSFRTAGRNRIARMASRVHRPSAPSAGVRSYLRSRRM
jgi:hypothetical protein